MNVQTKIRVDALPSDVWNVLTDFESYPQWNTMIPRFKGEANPGAEVRLSLRIGFVDLPINARMIKADGNELRWGGPTGLLSCFVGGEHYFRLRAQNESTLVYHGEEFFGWFVPSRADVLVQQLKPIYQTLSQALKKRVESICPKKVAS